MDENRSRMTGSDASLAQSFQAISTFRDSPRIYGGDALRVVTFDYVSTKHEISLVDQVASAFGQVLSTPLPPAAYLANDAWVSDADLAFVDRMRDKQLQAFYLMNPETRLVS